MFFYIHLQRFLFLIFVHIYYFGSCSAQTRNRDPTSGREEDNIQGSLHFLYQTPEYPRDCREVRDQCSSSISNGVYLIKPDGYPEPFEVYCNNDIDSGGWTVIQRRFDGSLGFNRYWEEYKQGFGFPSSEFWIGNDRLSFLTNQNKYELRIDVLLSNGSPFYEKYNSFRISDEWRNYALISDSAGNYTGDAGSVITPCPQNTAYYGCTCEATCEDPLGESDCQTNCDQNKTCVCQKGLLRKEEKCVTFSECGCYISEESKYISDGEVYINVDCTENCTCNGHQLNCDVIACSSDATCKVQEGVRQCSCNDGYTGDGKTCTADSVFTDCNDVRDAGHTADGVYSILPSRWPDDAFNVFCNMTIDGGGWTVFQRRDGGTTSFYKNWESYKNGFGNIQDNFWLGNDKLFYLTQQGTYEIRVDFVSSSNSARFSKFTNFRIDSESTKYRVTSISWNTGNGGNGMADVINEKFSTYDQDNDDVSGNCAEGHRGGWWYWYYYSYSYSHCYYWQYGSRYRYCSNSNPNGDYNGGNGQNIFWYDYYYYDYCNVKYIEMKIRRT